MCRRAPIRQASRWSRQRRLVDGRLTDWVVVRNRLSTLGSRNKRLVGEGLIELAERMGFRWVDGFAERVIYREFFPRGLTALDDLDKATLGTRPSKSHVAAREEVISLLNLLHLPLSENGKRRAAARAEWYSVIEQPLQVHESSAKPSHCTGHAQPGLVGPFTRTNRRRWQRCRCRQIRPYPSPSRGIADFSAVPSEVDGRTGTITSSAPF